MSALWAIVLDTWRQSRQQVVFMILVGMLGLIALGSIIAAKPISRTDDDGVVREHVTLLGAEGSDAFLEEGWVLLYSSTLMVQSAEADEAIDPFSEEGQKLQQELIEVANQAARMAPKQRGVEVMLFGVATMVFSLSMMLFIAAASGYYPAMLEAGAIDIVLAKPLARWQVFFGKFLGGLALYSAALAACYLLIFVGFGLRTGVWHPAIALILPLQIFAAACIYALIGLIGLLRRSATLAMVLGYVYYVVVDGIVSVFSNLPFDVPWMKTTRTILRATVPNFDSIKSAATMSVINVPAIDWQPILVAGVWLIASLGLGWWKFQKTDY